MQAGPYTENTQKPAACPVLYIQKTNMPEECTNMLGKLKKTHR